MNIPQNSLSEILLAATAVVAAIIFIAILYHFTHRRDITKMYRRTNILTDREYKFYLKLRDIADEAGVRIFTKVRLADLVEPKPTDDGSLRMECFNKIRAKHIDFALADDDTNILVLIELDDSTHERKDRAERDKFVDAVLENTGYLLIRTYGDTNEIEEFLSTENIG